MGNENEARDERGRWTASGVGSSDAHAHPAGPYMDISKQEEAAKADRVANLAAKVANRLGYDPQLINVSDASHQFVLNGKTLNTGGWATKPPEPKLVTNPDGSKQVWGAGGTGNISLFTPHIGNDDNTINGVVAHEIFHQKFNAFNDDAHADSLKMQQDPDYHKDTKWVPYDPENESHVAMKARGDMVTSPQADGKPQIRELGFMNPNGTLNEPYASKYPAYQAKATLDMNVNVSQLEKSDGVSDYSKEYWLGTHKEIEGEYTNKDGNQQKFTTSSVAPMLAVNETLAEIARLKYNKETVYHKKLGYVEDDKPVYFSQGQKGVNPKWAAFYRAVDENWKRRNRK